MSVSEGVSARVAYKAYSTGIITSNAQAVSSSDPGASGAQILRRTGCTLSLSKDTYASNEVRTDRQIGDFRHGVRRVQGSITGELSPGTYWDFIEAACRGTETSAISKTESDYTSVTADNATSKFTFGGGNPVTDGFKVGMVIRFTNLSETGNNSKNFMITGFGGSNNREVTVFPAPTTMSSDTAFGVASIGKRVIVPASGHVSRKFAVETYHADLDIARLFTECRVGGVNLGLPASGMSTIEIPMMGRDMETYSAGSAPFFSSPTDVTTTGIAAAVNGLIRVQGVAQGVITGAQVNMALNPSADPVVGQNFVPEIFLGRANVTGQLTAFLEDLTLVDYFRNETEVSILLQLLTSSADASDFITIFMPKVKFGDAQVGIEGEGGVPITMPFQALRYGGSTAGVDTTTIAYCDSAAA
jgi:hypothetical protein